MVRKFYLRQGRYYVKNVVCLFI